MKRLIEFLLISCLLATFEPAYSQKSRDIRTDEYRQLQEKLCSGWNTWYNNSLISHVLLPEGLVINMSIATDDNRKMLKEVFKSADINGRPERVFPGMRSDDGSYTSLDLSYEGINLKIETAVDGDDFVALVTPEKPSADILVVELGMAYGRDGMIGKKDDSLVAACDGKEWTVQATGDNIPKEYLTSTSPRLNVMLDGKQAIYTGKQRSLEEIERIVAKERQAVSARVESYGNLADAFLSMQTILAWNTIYDAPNHRAITPVSRNWNQGWGGYVLFDWDTYFAAYMFSLFNKELAYANAVEITKAITPDGFIPNFQSVSGYVKDGNTSSWDRSQPPVGSKVIWEIYSRYREEWFLEEVYDELLTWNRWWDRKRNNKGYLAWGSHFIKEGKDVSEGLQGAMYESGLDNSPMYDDVPMNEDNLMELADVGLMSMYVMDCNILKEIALVLGHKEDAKELSKRSKIYSKALESLWDEETGIYRNKRLDTGELSPALSPTNFYPMLAGCPVKHVERMINEHYFNPDEFHGEYILPSIARNCTGFTDNDYWRGRIWGPMNFLVYLGMQNYDIKEARQDLVDKSYNLLMKNWKKNGGIFENYNSITGEGDDVYNADGFYHWGALLTFMGFLESETAN